MNSLETLRSNARKVTSLRRPNLAKKKDEVLGAGNCDPKTE
jgi:hypothetical protein